MWQMAIDFGNYVLAAIIGAAVLFILASIGAVEIPQWAKRRNIARDNRKAARGGQIIPAEKAARLRETWDEATAVKAVDEPARGSV
jgi:hypothetical protein